MPSWTDEMPEGFAELPFVKDTADMDQFAANLRNAANVMGNSIPLPSAEATEEQLKGFQEKVIERYKGLMPTPNPDDDEAVNAVLSRLGRPDAAEKYALPEGVEIEGEALGTLQAEAHELGLTQRQFAARAQKAAEAAAEAQEAQEAFFAQQGAVMKEEWGQAYDSRIEEISSFLAAEGTPEDIKAAFGTGKINAESMRWLHKMSQLGDEETGTVRQQGNRGDPKLDPAQASQELSDVSAKIFKDPDTGRPMSPSHPDFERLNKRRIDLIRMGAR